LPVPHWPSRSSRSPLARHPRHLWIA